MLLTEVLPLLVRYWPIVLVSLVAGHLISNKYWNGLHKYPGPALAAYSNWWRLRDVSKKNHHWTTISLHREHGDVVRLGPNVLSFANPKAIKAIYGLNKGVSKVSSLLVDHMPTVADMISRTSTPFRVPWPTENLFTHYSRPPMKTFMPNTVDA